MSSVSLNTTTARVSCVTHVPVLLMIIDELLIIRHIDDLIRTLRSAPGLASPTLLMDVYVFLVQHQ